MYYLLGSALVILMSLDVLFCAAVSLCLDFVVV